MALLMLLANCTPYTYTYVSPLPNDPAFVKGGEVKVGGDIGVFNSHLQAAVAPISYFTLVGGISKGYAGQNAYNFGGQVYIPTVALKKGKIYMAFMAYYEGGNMSQSIKNEEFYANGVRSFDINMSYGGISYQPSIYYVTKDNSDNTVKLGVTYRIASINYKHLLFEERWLNYETSITTTEFTANARNINFYGQTAWGYFMYEDKQNRFFAISQLGLAFSSYTARKVTDSKKNYRFSYFPLITGTFGIRLWRK